MGAINRKRNNRRSAPRLRLFKLPALPWRRIGMSLAGLSVIALAFLGLTLLLNQPIQRVIVSGRLQRVSALDVEKIVRLIMPPCGAAGRARLRSRSSSRPPWHAGTTPGC
jgi:hypothetical protein